MIANPSMDFSNLVGICVVTTSDSPDWLVSNFNVTYINIFQLLQRNLQLPGDHLLRSTRFALIERLTDAQNGAEIISNRSRKFPGDDLVAFMKNMAALRVTDEHVGTACIAQHDRANLACECASVFPVAVLAPERDYRPGDPLLHLGQSGCRGRQYQGSFRTFLSDTLHDSARKARRL